MGVTISKPAINIREKLTEASAVVPYEQRQFHFDNLVTNGTFDADISGWTDGNAEGTIAWNAGGYMDLARNSGSGGNIALQNTSTVDGATYVVSFDIVSLSHGLSARLGLTISPTYTTTGTKSFTTVAGLNDQLGFNLSNSATATASIDNISVYEIDPSDNKVIHTMPKGWKPLHVYEDGVLQREGSAYDYTVEYDGFNYIVKETVTPVAPYSTTVIGVRA